MLVNPAHIPLSTLYSHLVSHSPFFPSLPCNLVFYLHFLVGQSCKRRIWDLWSSCTHWSYFPWWKDTQSSRLKTEVTGKFWNWRKRLQMRLCVCVCLWPEYEVLEVGGFWVKSITLLPHLFGNMIWSDSMLSSVTFCTMYFLEVGHGTGGQMTKGVS